MCVCFKGSLHRNEVVLTFSMTLLLSLILGFCIGVVSVLICRKSRKKNAPTTDKSRTVHAVEYKNFIAADGNASRHEILTSTQNIASLQPPLEPIYEQPDEISPSDPHTQGNIAYCQV